MSAVAVLWEVDRENGEGSDICRYAGRTKAVHYFVFAAIDVISKVSLKV